MRENVPGFRRSSVDGYAVKAKDTFGSSENMPGFLNVAGEVKMGEAPEKAFQDGEAIYVPTGGMLPDGSDAVIMIEHCEDLSGLLNLYRQVAPGENVISIGEDLKEGEPLVNSRNEITFSGIRGTRFTRNYRSSCLSKTGNWLSFDR